MENEVSATVDAATTTPQSSSLSPSWQRAVREGREALISLSMAEVRRLQNKYADTRPCVQNGCEALLRRDDRYIRCAFCRQKQAAKRKQNRDRRSKSRSANSRGTIKIRVPSLVGTTTTPSPIVPKSAAGSARRPARKRRPSLRLRDNDGVEDSVAQGVSRTASRIPTVSRSVTVDAVVTTNGAVAGICSSADTRSSADFGLSLPPPRTIPSATLVHVDDDVVVQTQQATTVVAPVSYDGRTVEEINRMAQQYLWNAALGATIAATYGTADEPPGHKEEQPECEHVVPAARPSHATMPTPSGWTWRLSSVRPAAPLVSSSLPSSEIPSAAASAAVVHSHRQGQPVEEMPVVDDSSSESDSDRSFSGSDGGACDDKDDREESAVLALLRLRRDAYTRQSSPFSIPFDAAGRGFSGFSAGNGFGAAYPTSSCMSY